MLDSPDTAFILNIRRKKMSMHYYKYYKFATYQKWLADHSSESFCVGSHAMLANTKNTNHNQYKNAKPEVATYQKSENMKQYNHAHFLPNPARVTIILFMKIRVILGGHMYWVDLHRLKDGVVSFACHVGDPGILFVVSIPSVFTCTFGRYS